MTKAQTTKLIIELANRVGDVKAVDKVNDWSAKYAAKFLKVIEKLKK